MKKNRTRISISPLLCTTVLEVIANTKGKKEKEIEDIQIGEEEVKLHLYMIGLSM